MLRTAFQLPAILQKTCFLAKSSKSAFQHGMQCSRLAAQESTVNSISFRLFSTHSNSINGKSSLSCLFQGNKVTLYFSLKRLIATKAPAKKLSGTSVSYRNLTGMLWYLAGFVFMLGMSYAGVPLYRMFCQSVGLGGQAELTDTSVVSTMTPNEDRLITIKFNADISSSMTWNFRPQQTEVVVAPGETALAFYTATNPTDQPVIGISTYNVVPFECGEYFNKIQCFCFEEQRLNPHEQVDMPVFFFIDPEFAEDPKLETVDEITLSYTFFEAKPGLELPLPNYMR